MERRADISWEGALEGGIGTIWGASGSLRQLLVNSPSRTQSSGGWTNPEELLAAAHASSYAMALARTLAERGAAIQRFDASSTFTVDERGTTITAVRLGVLGNVGGVDDAAFAEAAEAAVGSCQISTLLKATAEITVEAARRDYRLAIPATSEPAA